MKRPTRLTVTVTVAALALVAVTGWWVAGIASAAKAGKVEAKAGVTYLASLDATSAASHFGAATRILSRAKGMMGPEWFGAAVGAVPLVGRQYSAARALVEIGLDGSTAGAGLAEALQTASVDRTGAGSAGRSGPPSETRVQHLETALTALVGMADRTALMDERGLVAPLAKEIRSLKATLRSVAPVLDRFRALQPLQKYLLSSRRRILVVSQDGAELRPTGGFAGSFGVIQAGPDGVKLEEYRDVYVLPDSPGRVVPPAGARFTRDFGFRDANWWIDFPTSARTMLGFWRDCGQPPVDGIVVVDTIAMAFLLEALGPVRVPSFSETFTPENLLTRLLYYTQVTGAGREDRKGVLVALATELEHRMLGSSPQELAKAALALVKAADAKHVQMYWTDPEAQAAVIALGWSGRVTAPSGTTDLLVISNAMNMGSKINMAMKKTIDYEVTLMPDRWARSALTLGYSNTGPFAVPGRDFFSNWLRVSRPPGTSFALSGGGYETVEYGLPTEVRTFSVLRGETRTETIVSHVPAVWRKGGSGDSASSVVNENSWSWGPSGASHYRLFIARQADLEDIPTTVSITPPSGWRVTSAKARLVASGVALAATIEDGRARLTCPLAGDLVFDVWLASR